MTGHFTAFEIFQLTEFRNKYTHKTYMFDDKKKEETRRTICRNQLHEIFNYECKKNYTFLLLVLSCLDPEWEE